jgi:hypothetical protein
VGSANTATGNSSNCQTSFPAHRTSGGFHRSTGNGEAAKPSSSSYYLIEINSKTGTASGHGPSNAKERGRIEFELSPAGLLLPLRYDSLSKKMNASEQPIY